MTAGEIECDLLVIGSDAGGLSTGRLLNDPAYAVPGRRLAATGKLGQSGRHAHFQPHKLGRLCCTAKPTSSKMTLARNAG